MAKDREASTVLLVRGQGEDLEIYLVERAPQLRFFGGYQALPGGVLEQADGASAADRETALRQCGVRELFEETGVLLHEVDADETRLDAVRTQMLDDDLQGWSEITKGTPCRDLTTVCRIRTPPFAPVRYDTLFFLADMPVDQAPTIREGELVGGAFWRPADALAAWRRGEILIVPPVIILLELMVGRDRPAFLQAAADIADSYQRGALHRVRFSPGIIMASLATPTLPPATTTNCLLIGESRLYIVDPATPDEAEQQRLFSLLDELRDEGAELASILLTHHHPDHVGAAQAVSDRYDLPVRGHERTLSRLPHLTRAGAPIADGDVLELGTAPDGSDGWHLRAIFTPGHDQGHLCFLESRYRALVGGDMMSTVSTIVIDPPEGHLRTYMQSLEALGKLELGHMYPAHGPAARDGNAVVAHYIKHRTKRQNKLVDALRAGPATVEGLLPVVYDDVHEKLFPYAARSLAAGLQMLEEEGAATESDGTWTLAAG